MTAPSSSASQKISSLTDEIQYLKTSIEMEEEIIAASKNSFATLQKTRGGDQGKIEGQLTQLWCKIHINGPKQITKLKAELETAEAELVKIKA